MTQVSKSSGGVLQIPVAATQKNAPTPAKKAPKPPAPRLKLLVRRLPPGLTQAEFESILGEEWKVGAGKVDWSQYKTGKVSKDPAKPSRPSRAYIHVVSSDHIAPLSDKVRQSSFLDSKGTSNDAVLLGPPSLEFAPYAKIPGSRVRKDARQGTIDQDPDFFAFLESLTQPIAKPAPDSGDGEEKKDEAVTTPLVQYIKEKKANKAKESSSKSKHGKFDKESKPEKVQAKKLLQRPDRESQAEKPEKKTKADKAAKDAVKAANKQAASVSKQGGKSTSQNSSKDSAPAPLSERKREPRNVAAATKILQRNLGLGGGRRKGAKSAVEDECKDQTASPAPESNRKDAVKSTKGGARGKSNQTPQSSEPVSRVQSDVGSPPTSSTPTPSKSNKSGKGKQAPASTFTATQAFLKHANASQGVTEPLLETAFAPFGKISKVEIDKKKGFGYIDFAEPASLQKAIAASPVTVAQSQVVVLERKANPGGEKSRGKPREPQPKDNKGGKANGEGSRGRGRGPRNKGAKGSANANGAEKGVETK